MDTFGIGALARTGGVGIDTVRYYERSGLLAPARRLPSGYRRYGQGELARLRFILRAKALGFTLQEIAELLDLSGRRDVARVRRAAESKLAGVVDKIRSLQRVKSGLEALIRDCPGRGAPANCPILNALGAGEL
jgi:DNA-binding transcriptional MerR regulator